MAHALSHTHAHIYTYSARPEKANPIKETLMYSHTYIDNIYCYMKEGPTECFQIQVANKIR